ncbi:MAG: alanine/glycine:cation symporter family protein [Oscillospiraceae bacterium]|nr:sodium:alanine symporter family protein [Clostridiales bacterium]MDD6937227.1 sodium:alanine symporter family protein [Clostridiales bacterium]MDY2960971.1 sodium:alanine symporter family protein [Oscillospiraceae bacterium]
MDALLAIVQKINLYLSDYILIILLIGAGLYFSIRTKFVQVRCFGEGWRRVFGNFSLKGGKHGGGMSSFQALATAIAAQVGTGNIVGACGAILIGGPGAIFWMWIIAFFGMATIYAEAVLAQETRVVQADGTVQGGPVYYIKTAFKGGFGKFLAGFFAVAIILALGFMGAMVQSNSIGEACHTAFGIPTWVVGLIIAILAAVIFIGGVQRLASVTEKLVPIMAFLYIIGGLIVLIARIKYIPETFGMIFKYAFVPNAIIGGGIGYALKTAISQGVKRGLFSNEAGMGSTPHAHAMAQVEKPHDQGVVAMIGVFIDTFIVLTMTALVVISTLYAGDGILASGAADGVAKTNMAQLAFSVVFGEKLGSAFVAICLLFFAFSTIISWNLFGRINVNYLFGKKANLAYSIIAIVFIFLGSCLSNDLVWELTDMFNQLMVLPNVIAIVPLAGLVVAASRSSKDHTLK